MANVIRVTVSDEVWKLFENICPLEMTHNDFARFLLLSGLSCEYQASEKDDVVRRIEEILKKLKKPKKPPV